MGIDVGAVVGDGVVAVVSEHGIGFNVQHVRAQFAACWAHIELSWKNVQVSPSYTSAAPSHGSQSCTEGDDVGAEVGAVTQIRSVVEVAACSCCWSSRHWVTGEQRLSLVELGGDDSNSSLSQTVTLLQVRSRCSALAVT